MSINRMLVAHYHHCKPKLKKHQFFERVDSGSFSGRNKLLLGSSKYKLAPLGIHSSFFAFIFVFWGALTFKEVSPACTRVVQEHPSCAHRQKIIFPCTHAIVTKTTHVHPPTSGKNKKARVNSPNFRIL
jgi:hypothetical protein